MIGPPFFFAQITLRIACARLVSFSDNLTSVSPESRGRSIAPWNGPHKTENAWRTRRVPFIDGTLAARQEGNSLHLLRKTPPTGTLPWRRRVSPHSRGSGMRVSRGDRNPPRTPTRPAPERIGERSGRRRDRRAVGVLALLWQILSGTGFPNQFFCDSWVVGFWRGRPWLAGCRIGKTSLNVGSCRF